MNFTKEDIIKCIVMYGQLEERAKNIAQKKYFLETNDSITEISYDINKSICYVLTSDSNSNIEHCSFPIECLQENEFKIKEAAN